MFSGKWAFRHRGVLAHLPLLLVLFWRRGQQRHADVGRGTGFIVRRNGAADLGAVLYSPSAEGAAGIDDRGALPTGTQSSLYWQRVYLRERHLLRAASLAGSFHLVLVLRRLLRCRRLRRRLASATLWRAL